MTVDHPAPATERPTAFPWPPVLIAGAVLGAWGLGRIAPVPWPGVDDWPAPAIGLGLGAIGVGLLVWAARTLRLHNTTILPNKGADALVTSGPYHHVRNPIYLADVLIFLGLAEVTKNVWFVAAALVFAVLVTILAIGPEERHLEAKFAGAYRDYKARTRRWI